MKILVVDDDMTARLLMLASLTRAGYDVVLAESGEEALILLADHPMSMVMLDVDMPGMNGIQTCREIRARIGKQMPIVMVTGMDDVESVSASYDAGATDFFSKPLNWALLGHRVQYLLRANAALNEVEAAHAQTSAILKAIPDDLVRLRRPNVGSAVWEPVSGDALRFDLLRTEPELNAVFNDAVEAGLETGRPQDVSYHPAHDHGIGTRRHLEVRATMIDDTDALCLIRDITHRKQIENELIQSEAKLQQAQAVAGLGSWHLTWPECRLTWSPQTYRILGVAPDRTIDFDGFLALIHPDDRPALARLKDPSTLGESETIEFRVPALHRPPTWVLQRAGVELDEHGDPCGVLGTVQDITARKESEARIARLAFHDSLTELPNREAFLDKLGREVARARSHDRRIAVLFIDLDGFKNINDSLGHDVGDVLLQAAADRLREIVRTSDIVSRAVADDAVEGELGRLGGDEFTALLRDLRDSEYAMLAANRIREQMCLPYHIGGRDLRLSASIGISVYPEDGQDGATLMKNADAAMYQAKRMGRNNCQFYSADLTRRALQLMNMNHDLRVAIEREQFMLAYQPQIDVATGRVVSFEALLRWQHPERGIVAPLEFIPAAEENGLIIPIGHWVIRTACQDAARWRLAGADRHGRGPRIAVNVSTLQLNDPKLAAVIQQAVSAAGLAPDQLELELAERSVMENRGSVLATLKTLRGDEVRISLDDFGTGFSSVSGLQRMPLATLKVDRSFVQGVPGSIESEAVVSATIAMAHSLGFKVTAEGVETLEQARRLAALGCDILQGYYFSRPVPVDEVPSHLDRIWPLA